MLVKNIENWCKHKWNFWIPKINNYFFLNLHSNPSQIYEVPWFPAQNKTCVNICKIAQCTVQSCKCLHCSVPTFDFHNYKKISEMTKDSKSWKKTLRMLMLWYKIWKLNCTKKLRTWIQQNVKLNHCKPSNKV